MGYINIDDSHNKYIYQLWSKSISVQHFTQYIINMNNLPGFEDEHVSKPITTRSCKESIGEDPIRDQISQIQHIPRPKSYKSGSDESEWNNLTSTDKKQHKEGIVKNLITSKPAKKQKMKQKNKQETKQQGIPPYKMQRNDRKFTQNLDQSVQVEGSESTSQDQVIENRLEQQRVIAPSKKRQFNLLLLGAASTGKTTYTQCFLRQYKQHNNENKLIKQHTQKITQYKSPTMSSNLSLDFYIIDTPGYTHGTIGEYCMLIEQQIKNRIENTRKSRKKVMTQSSVYEKQERQVRDQRIHCCLFFFRGPRLHSDDWLLLERLYDKCNIIPVIAKGDCYTVQEIAQLKKSIITRAAEKGIKWFNIEEYMRQKYPDKLHLVTKGPYGSSPPFMIACSTTQIEQDRNIKIGRQFKWGTCYIEDERHTQFKTLNKLLTIYLHDGFVKMIDIMEDGQKEKIEKETKGINKGNRLAKLFGIGVGCMIVVLVARKLGSHELLKNH